MGIFEWWEGVGGWNSLSGQDHDLINTNANAMFDYVETGSSYVLSVNRFSMVNHVTC